MEYGKTFAGVALAVTLVAGCGGDDDKSLAQKTGETLGAATLDFTKGVAESVMKNDKEGDKETEKTPPAQEERLSTKVGTVMGGGVMNALGTALKTMEDELRVTVEADDSLKANNLTVEQGKEKDAVLSLFTVYVVSEKKFKGNLLAKAFDNAGREVGRAKSAVDLDDDGANWVDLEFPKQMSTSAVVKLQLSAKK